MSKHSIDINTPDNTFLVSVETGTSVVGQYYGTAVPRIGESFTDDSSRQTQKYRVVDVDWCIGSFNDVPEAVVTVKKTEG